MLASLQRCNIKSLFVCGRCQRAAAASGEGVEHSHKREMKINVTK